MRLKNFFVLMLAAISTAAIFTGCGGDTAPADNSQQEIKIGRIKFLNASEELYDEVIKKFQERAAGKISNYKTTFYDNLSMLQMGLESGSVQQISVYKSVADYLTAKNSKFEISSKQSPVKLEDNFAFAMRTEDTELKNSVNAAVEAMKNDGTLENLIKTYITDLNPNEDPPAVAFETFAGADTIKIGVTGDLPPLDFVSADGKAAGFNTALLSELAKRLQKNIDIIQIDSAARAAALSAKTIDISFWAIVPSNEDMPVDIDKPQGVEFSAPYFKDEITHIDLKK